ncbi:MULTISPECIES: helix-turn-helix transcriptional regulator [unclassified Cellulophaga]|uniref:helix-turn-helix transcriptional regulator n=1 Tax=unclassified Cellulophaga TaxID=2634405 RepID=UPI000C2CC9B2|nr:MULTISPECIES: YafY family protein [unclassified Cellulophaga]MDO6490599.1 YafY family protein [Cellulophaga sp. 2_MG-2023]MDO6494207.1 YafY family protein [Cellulophaga sp. 3_MG-2023]PKB45137.1 putative DNA-binding transcriptional regulator YafY [Cellulophaga sp. RHA19]
MEKGKPRLVRLTAIVTQLQTKKVVTATELSAKHKVSVRTIYRDIRTLEQSGIPIYTEEGKGYSLVDGYKLPPVMFTEEEANALITAEQIVSRNKDISFVEKYSSAVEKIKSVLRYSQRDKSSLLTERIDIRTNLEQKITSNYLMQLQIALTNYKLLQIDYLSLERNKTTRIIEPFALIHNNDNWVLIAFCRLREDFRAFRVDCIQQLAMLPSSFEPHKITLQEYFDIERKKWENTPDIPMT